MAAGARAAAALRLPDQDVLSRLNAGRTAAAAAPFDDGVATPEAPLPEAVRDKARARIAALLGKTSTAE